MDIFEAVYTLRAMRRLKPDPVDEKLIWKVLDAAIRAPSGGNRQPWKFIVLTDDEKKGKIGEWYLDGWNNSYGKMKDRFLADPAGARMYGSADHLANHIREVPVLIFPCVDNGGVAAVSGAGANIFPAVQNLMLAARALGLGTTLTTLHRTHDAEVKELLGIPDRYDALAMIPMGWPVGKFGTGPRRPIEEVTYWDSWKSTKHQEE
ncbi:MAG: nitroreductase family protein [Dehalococcoidia bacterium]